MKPLRYFLAMISSRKFVLIILPSSLKIHFEGTNLRVDLILDFFPRSATQPITRKWDFLSSHILTSLGHDSFMNIVYLSPLKFKESSILDEKGYRKKIETYPNFYLRMNFLNWALSELFYEIGHIGLWALLWKCSLEVQKSNRMDKNWRFACSHEL